MATCFGWTWEYIDECVTLPRCYEIWAAWRDCPPQHVAIASIARFLGAIKPPGTGRPSRAAAVSDEGSGDVVRDLAAAGIPLASGALDPRLKAMLDE